MSKRNVGLVVNLNEEGSIKAIEDVVAKGKTRDILVFWGEDINRAYKDGIKVGIVVTLIVCGASFYLHERKRKKEEENTNRIIDECLEKAEIIGKTLEKMNEESKES